MSSLFMSSSVVSKANGFHSSKVRAPPKFRHTSHLEKKVSKIRWLRSGQALLLPDPLSTEYFVAGSWGELENDVSLWKFAIGGTESDGIPEVELVKRTPLLGNVTGMTSLRNDLFGLTSSTGALELYKLSQLDSTGLNPKSFELVGSNKLHSFSNSFHHCSATGIATNDKSVVSVGEDGSIYELTLETNQLEQSLKSVDPLSLCTVEYVSRTEIATGNMGGQVSIWDLRRGSTPKPVQTLNHLDELSGAISIAQHPTQSHVILVGFTSGSLNLFDLRGGESSEPIASLQQQEGGVSEIYFHRITPDHFFTCSQNGDVLHWFPGDGADGMDLVQNNDYETDLNLEFLKYGLSYKTLNSSPFPVNSMSLSRNNRLICGGDSGLVFCTEVNQL